MAEEQVWQVDVGYFCCGIVTMPQSRVGEVVVDAAPIMAWAKHKTLKYVEKWVDSKRGTLRRAW